jgi:plasmid stability protein
MKPLVVRDIEDELVVALERRAVRNGRSIEAEHRQILREVLLGEVQASSPDTIDAMYDELSRLVALRDPDVEDAALESRIAEILRQLRHHQEVEAKAMQERFQSRLTMPIEAGRDVLDEIETFLGRARDEDRSP